MRRLSIILSFVGALAVLGGCRNVSNGSCNVCPGATAVDTSQCAAQGTTYHCTSAKLVQKTDNSCGNADAGGYQSCVFVDCDIGFDCKKVANY